ncbi:hypothetical protein EVAR_28574_1 [Eumeta japonica]|uniref:Uncharacterized protein n=1 Tax=Eumeta variegata TaxID=151549 RepID=A0A4C1UWQ7_EUMVA|nr:hypothetical protein EVAR_28574_1 [Eumeta japonica]
MVPSLSCKDAATSIAGFVSMLACNWTYPDTTSVAHKVDGSLIIFKLSSSESCCNGLFAGGIRTVQCTKLCRSELNDVMRTFNTPRPFFLLPRVSILRHWDAFVTNFAAAEFRALYRTDAPHHASKYSLSAKLRRRFFCHILGLEEEYVELDLPQFNEEEPIEESSLRRTINACTSSMTAPCQMVTVDARSSSLSKVTAQKELQWQNYEDGPTRPVKHHTLTEYGREVAVCVVAFRPESESSSGPLVSPPSIN